MSSIGSTFRLHLARRRRPASWPDDLVAWAFLTPLATVLAAFNTVVSSFFSWGLLAPWKATDTSTWSYVGLGNYRETLADPDFWNAAFNTTVWLVFFPALVVGGSLLVTILIWHLDRGAG